MSSPLDYSQKPGVSIHLIHYDTQAYEESGIHMLSDIKEYLAKPATSWLDIDGTHCTRTISFLKDTLQLHPLLIEDILHPDHRPKIDGYDEYAFVLVKMLHYDDKMHKIKAEQVSFILGKNYLISLQESGKGGDIFGEVRTRIKNDQGRHRKLGPDYLLYSLLDSIIDHYFDILEKVGERIETLEDAVINQPSERKLNEIYILKRELIQLRHSVWPLREVLNKMDKDTSELIKPPVHLYLREAYDHTIQVIETLESYRDILSGLIDIYLSSISNKMNAVMKVLTVISTIFMPLTFIAGIYGMNFNFMPELTWKYGYPTVLAICLVIALIMLLYFRRKKWL